jgi:hypothetical protein
MRYTDLVGILKEADDINQAVLDVLTTIAGEGVGTANFGLIQQELSAQGYDVDDNALFDILNNLAIVRNIENDVVHFNTDSDQSKGQSRETDPEKDKKHVSKLARKQVKKGLDK